MLAGGFEYEILIGSNIVNTTTMRNILIPIYIILSFPSLFAQGYEGSPCQCCNPLPQALINKKTIEGIFIDDCGPNPGPISSSFLKASGKAPLRTSDPNFKPPANWSEADGDYEYDSWTCMYASSRATDGNESTAWVEGVLGNGKGEVLLIPNLDISKKVEIRVGFAKSEALYWANARPKKIVVHVVRAQPKYNGATQCGQWFENVTWISSQPVTLQDVNRYQPLPLPAFKKETFKIEGEDWDYQYWLMIELVDVYPGKKYEDTCISEIRNVQ